METTLLILVIAIIGAGFIIKLILDDPYNEGTDAYMDGFPIQSNPYCRITEIKKHNKWIAGYNTAKHRKFNW